MKTVSVAIPTVPSRSLDKTIGSVLAQERCANIQIVVATDKNAPKPTHPAISKVVSSTNYSQSVRTNTALAAADGDYLAILHDDDTWHPAFLRTALTALEDADFVSSSQLEVDEKGEVIRIFDYPVPSSWVMRRAVWERVGPFDTRFGLHLDMDWLGRLGDSGVERRAHLLESTAPIDLKIAYLNRPAIYYLVVFGQPKPQLIRHRYPVPLVVKQVHPDTYGQLHLRQDPQVRAQSGYEYSRIMERFARTPW